MEQRKRKKPTLRVKLCSALREVYKLRKKLGMDTGLPCQAVDEMSDAEILAKTDWDHTVFHVWGGADDSRNLTPLPQEYHRKVKTPKDQKVIAKVRRSERKKRIEAALNGDIRDGFENWSKKDKADLYKKAYRQENPAPSRKIPSRPFPKSNGVSQWKKKRVE